MEVEGHAEELWIEREGEVKVSMNLVCNKSINVLSIRP